MFKQPDQNSQINFFPAISDFINERSENDLFSGAILIAKNYEPILEFSTGFANQKREIKNTITTKFNLGSANKMFTGVAVAQLAEKKLLNFNDTVGKFIPDYPNKVISDEVTIDQLLTHRSGLGSFIDLKYRTEFLSSRNNLKTITDVVKLFQDRPLANKPGEFNYSADGFELLGAIIESISGQSYYDYVRENIFKVANMPDTDSYEIDPLNPREDVAIGYTHRDPKTDQTLEGDRFDNFGLNLFKGTASGAGYSTCHDLLNFAKALLENKLLSPEMTNIVLSPKVKEGSKGNQTKYYGYGFQIFDIDAVRRIGHPGRFAGVNVRFDMYPELGYTVVVLSNYDPPAAFDIAEKVTELIVAEKSP